MLGVGDEVICVDDKRPDGWSAEHYPEWVEKDAKYIIREIFDNDEIVVGVLVEELRNPIIYQPLLGRDQEAAFATWRFAPLRTAYEIAEEEESKRITKKVEKELEMPSEIEQKSKGSVITNYTFKSIKQILNSYF